jgi:butyryl-CoA dehydrogenase
MAQDIIFSPLCEELGAKAREIAEKYVRPSAAKHDKAQEYNWEAARAVADAGLFRTFIPKEYGGHGAGLLALARVTEELARADSGFGVAYAVNALGSFPILVGGTEAQKQRWLPSIARGEKMVAFCLSEKFAGSDAGGLSVRATEDGDDYVICGEKKWTTNGGVADIYSVFAVTDPTSKSRRISAIVVEKGTPGFTIRKVEDKMGIRCVPVVETHFDHVRVPKANLIGERPGAGFKHAMMTLDLARPGVAAQAVGAAQGALDLAVVYANRRQQFGVPISNHQMVQKMLADMAMKTEAARWLVYSAAAMAEAGGPKATRMAAMAKCFATDTAMEVATDAVQIFGGYGFMEDYPIAKFFRDAKILQIYEGTNQIQRIVIARNLVKESGELEHLEAYIPREVQKSYEDEGVPTPSRPV